MEPINRTDAAREYARKWRLANPEKASKWKRANPEKVGAYRRKWYLANSEKAKEYSREWYRANREKAREHRRKWNLANREKVREQAHKRYIANRERVRELGRINTAKRNGFAAPLPAQHTFTGRCDICRNSIDKPHFDHCHITGVHRGWLCVSCNTGLGSFKDSIKRLENAIKYLLVWKA